MAKVQVLLRRQVLLRDNATPTSLPLKNPGINMSVGGLRVKGLFNDTSHDDSNAKGVFDATDSTVEAGNCRPISAKLDRNIVVQANWTWMMEEMTSSKAVISRTIYI